MGMRLLGAQRISDLKPVCHLHFSFSGLGVHSCLGMGRGHVLLVLIFGL